MPTLNDLAYGMMGLPAGNGGPWGSGGAPSGGFWGNTNAGANPAQMGRAAGGAPDWLTMYLNNISRAVGAGGSGVSGGGRTGGTVGAGTGAPATPSSPGTPAANNMDGLMALLRVLQGGNGGSGMGTPVPATGGILGPPGGWQTAF